MAAGGANPAIAVGRSTRVLPPGRRRGPFPFDNTLAILRDPRGFYEASEKRFGPVFTASFLGAARVQCLGPDANELVLADRDKAFSARLGWSPYFDRVFPRGILSMDFERAPAAPARAVGRLQVRRHARLFQAARPRDRPMARRLARARRARAACTPR